MSGNNHLDPLQYCLGNIVSAPLRGFLFFSVFLAGCYTPLAFGDHTVNPLALPATFIHASVAWGYFCFVAWFLCVSWMYFLWKFIEDELQSKKVLFIGYSNGFFLCLMMSPSLSSPVAVYAAVTVVYWWLPGLFVRKTAEEH